MIAFERGRSSPACLGENHLSNRSVVPSPCVRLPQQRIWPPSFNSSLAQSSTSDRHPRRLLKIATCVVELLVSYHVYRQLHGGNMTEHERQELLGTATFKLNKETKNTIRYALDAEHHERNLERSVGHGQTCSGCVF